MTTTRKKAYLTIDDSPSSSFIEKLNYLESKKIPAVFFCIGQLMEKRPVMMIDSIQRGVQIANHSYSHPAFSKISLEQAKYEIEKTDEIIQNLHLRAGEEWKQKWFRFPYGDKGDLKNGEVFNFKKQSHQERKDFIQKILLELEYTQPEWHEVTYEYMRKAQLFDELDWHWTFDLMEWATFEYKPTFGLKNLHKLIQRLNQKQPKDCRGDLGNEPRWLNSSSAEIILLHDHEETTPIFNALVDKMLEYPLEFVRLNAELRREDAEIR